MHRCSFVYCSSRNTLFQDKIIKMRIETTAHYTWKVGHNDTDSWLTKTQGGSQCLLQSL